MKRGQRCLSCALFTKPCSTYALGTSTSLRWKMQTVIARRPPRKGSRCVVALLCVLASMGTVPEAMEIKRPVQDKKLSPALTIGVPREWCHLWYDRAIADDIWAKLVWAGLNLTAADLPGAVLQKEDLPGRRCLPSRCARRSSLPGSSLGFVAPNMALLPTTISCRSWPTCLLRLDQRLDRSVLSGADHNGPACIAFPVR
jgi:hypothetical protein